MTILLFVFAPSTFHGNISFSKFSGVTSIGIISASIPNSRYAEFHNEGDLACIAAVASGAKIIEKHFTIDNNLPGGDNKLSMPPKDFQEMCKKIRDIEKMFFYSNAKPHPDEDKVKIKRIRKVVAKEDLKQGDKINISNEVDSDKENKDT